jgi:DNA-binding response OmpR family regulator
MSEQELRVERFGAFRIEANERALIRGKTPVPLAPKAFELLLYRFGRNRRGLLHDKRLR